MTAPRTSRMVNAEGAAAAPVPATSAMATVLSRHIIRDGEIVILLLKPSVWFIFLSSLRFAAIVLLLMGAPRILDAHLPPLNMLAIVEGGIFLILGRLTWATLQWTSRLYVLTDMRIVAISGVFNAQVFECPLRKVARTRVIYSSRERITRLGSVEIIPVAEDAPAFLWQTIAQPRLVHEQIVATINKAKQGGCLTPPS